MLWHIEGTNTYVLGSVHVTNFDPVRLPPTVHDVFVASNTVVFETDLSGIVDRKLLLLPNGGHLSDHVPKSTYAMARLHWLRLGLPEQNLLHLQPGAVAITLLMTRAAASGYVSSRGIDRFVWDCAIRDVKRRQQLETFETQISALIGSPIGEQASMLDHFVAQQDVAFSELAGMVSAWMQGKTEPFEVALAKRRQRWPITSDILVNRRNRDWVPLIAHMARDEEHRLIIVGALHMVGPNGLPELLLEHGLYLRGQSWQFPR